MSDFPLAKIQACLDASTLLFIRQGIALSRRWFGFGVRGFAQRGLLILPSLFIFVLGARCPRSLSSISSIIWLERHGDPRRLIPKARNII
jgi:hypothetical protein